MVRDNKFDAGELAIITFLQAKAYGKPYVLIPAPISGRFQHHCIGYNAEHGRTQPPNPLSPVALTMPSHRCSQTYC